MSARKQTVNSEGVKRKEGVCLISYLSLFTLYSFTLNFPSAVQAAIIEGFGKDAMGGTGKPIYHVTNLNNSGAGSLRDAISQSNRNIVFDVAGTINTPSDLSISGRSYITIDGETAPSPGITLSGGGALSIEDGAHHIIVKSIRVRGAADDNIRVYNSHDIAFDHVSSYDSGDGALDITEGSYNVTVQWSILIQPAGSGTMLIKYNTYEVTLHHNLFHGGARNPLLSVDETATTSSRTLADIRNNINWDWGEGGGTQYGYGVGVDHGAHANVVSNFFESHGTYYISPSFNLPVLAIELNHNGSGGKYYASGNVSGNGVNLNQGNVSTPFAAVAMTTEPTCTAASKVLAQSGVRPLDAIDQNLVSRVSLAHCPGAPPPSPCDVDSSGATNVTDVQLMVNQAIGVAACTADINHDSACNVIDVQRVVNAALGGQCVSS